MLLTKATEARHTSVRRRMIALNNEFAINVLIYDPDNVL